MSGTITNSKQPVADCNWLDQDELGIFCICAERYALGRRTYMPSIVCAIINQHRYELSDRDLYVLIQDIENPYGGYGDECDKAHWMDLLIALKREQERRKE